MQVSISATTLGCLSFCMGPLASINSPESAWIRSLFQTVFTLSIPSRAEIRLDWNLRWPCAALADSSIVCDEGHLELFSCSKNQRNDTCAWTPNKTRKNPSAQACLGKYTGLARGQPGKQQAKGKQEQRRRTTQQHPKQHKRAKTASQQPPKQRRRKHANTNKTKQQAQTKPNKTTNNPANPQRPPPLECLSPEL